MLEQSHAPKSEAITPGFSMTSILWVLCVLVAAVILWRLMDLVAAVIIAFTISAALLPLALRLERRGVPRVWTVVGVFTLLLAGVAALSVLTAPAIGAQLERLATRAPEQVGRASDWLAGKLSDIAGRPVRMPEVSGQIAQALSAAAVRALQITAGAADAVASLILVVVLAGFMLIDHRRFRAGFLRFVPLGARDTVARQWDQVQERVGGYVAGMALIAAEKGVVLTTALWLMGVPSALLLGLLAAVLNFIPYVGFWLVFLLAELLAFNADPMKAVWVLALFLGHEWFKSGFLGPYLMGRTMKLHPAVVLVAIAAGAKLFGVLGTLVAVPLAGAVSVVITDLLPAPPDTAVPEDREANRPSRWLLRWSGRSPGSRPRGS
jgi:predicted PurR-regulated permease PerM